MDMHLPHTSPSAGPGPDGEAASAAEAARQERRERRLAALENLRLMNEQAAARLTQYIDGQLTPEECPALARIADPSQALVRVSRSIRQIVALEERLDEDGEARDQRLKAEQAARDKARREAEARRERAAAAAPLNEKKRAIRHAVRNAHRNAEPGWEAWDREALLDDLFKDYEDYNDYSGDAAAIVAKLCGELGFVAEPPAGMKASAARDKHAVALLVAANYLRAVGYVGSAPAGPERANGQGPP